jgi:hypothetical protein
MGGKVVKAVRFQYEVLSALVLPRENIPDHLWMKVKSNSSDTSIHYTLFALQEIHTCPAYVT